MWTHGLSSARFLAHVAKSAIYSRTAVPISPSPGRSPPWSPLPAPLDLCYPTRPRPGLAPTAARSRWHAEQARQIRQSWKWAAMAWLAWCWPFPSLPHPMLATIDNGASMYGACAQIRCGIRLGEGWLQRGRWPCRFSLAIHVPMRTSTARRLWWPRCTSWGSSLLDVKLDDEAIVRVGESFLGSFFSFFD